MFSHRYKQEWSRASELLNSPTPYAYSLANKSDKYNADESAILLKINPTLDNEIFQAIVKKARLIKESFFKNDIFAVVPLYVTSVCDEQCLYCNFRAANQIQVERHRLNDHELLQEISFLINEKGYRTIELVYSTDHSSRIDAICRHIELVKKSLETVGGGLIGLNAEPFSEDEYRLLKSAGIDFIVLWQETYDSDVYQQMHPGITKKSNFEFRIDAYERMLKAGIEQIGMGVLSGLADWRKDWTMLFMHQEYLKKTYGMESPIIGIPRLKASEGAIIKKTGHMPTDDEFLLCIAAQCLFDPFSLPFVNTRENWDLCVRLSSGGGVLFTFNCSTIPGGYSLGCRGYQFPTFNFDIDLYAGKAVEEGFHTRMKWSFRDVEKKRTAEEINAMGERN